MKSLTKRQALFVSHLLLTGNGAKAARLAGYNPDRGDKEAWRLLNDERYSHVRKEYDRRLADAEEMSKLARQAIHESCMLSIKMDKRKALNVDDLDEAEAAQITSISVQKFESEHGQASENISVKLSSPAEARKMLFKLHGMDRVPEKSTDESDAEAEADLLGELVKLSARRRAAEMVTESFSKDKEGPKI